MVLTFNHIILVGEGQETNLSYNSRLGTVKLLLDLELLDEATKVCDGLLEEDDEVVAPWYLLGIVSLGSKFCGDGRSQIIYTFLSKDCIFVFSALVCTQE